jgi:hypothetical protein
VPGRQLVSSRIAEVKTRAAGKRKDLLRDRASCLFHPLNCSIEIVDEDHDERSPPGRRVTLAEAAA